METTDHPEEQTADQGMTVDTLEYDRTSGLEAINCSLEALTAVVSAFHGTIVSHLHEAHEIMRDAAELQLAMEVKQTDEQTRLQQAMCYIQSFQKRMFAEYEDDEEDEPPLVRFGDTAHSQHPGSAVSTPSIGGGSTGDSGSCNSSHDSGILVNFSDAEMTKSNQEDLI